MSEKTVLRRWLRNVVGLCLLIPRVTEAQTAEELRARVAILQEQLREAEELVRRAAAASRPALLSDTLRMGPVTLTVKSDDLALVRAARTDALQRLEDDLGQDLGVLQGLEISVSILRNQVYDLGPHSAGFTRGAALREGRRVEDLAAYLAEATYAALQMNNDVSLWNWLSTRPLPRDADQIDLVRAYRDLATSPFEVSTQCLRGDVGACRRALGLVETPDPLTEWYTEADRRALVDRAARPDSRFSPTYAATYDRCVDGGDDTACQAFLRPWRGGWFNPPLPSNVREALAYQALVMGGDGAYGRFFTTRGTIEQRLEAAAGAPIEAVIRSWRAALDDAVGEPTAVSWPLGLMSVFWAVALAALGLRSTRWR
jgi:hypothetical protein